MAKKSKGLKQKLVKLMLLIPALTTVAANVFSAAKFEILAIRKRLAILFILAASCLILLSSVWFGINALVLILLQAKGLSLAAAIAWDIAFNTAIFLILCVMMSLLKVEHHASPSHR